MVNMAFFITQNCSPLPFSKPLSSASSLSTSKTLPKPLTINSSSLPLSPTPHQNPTTQLTSFLKSTCITLVTTTLFLSRFTNPSFASPAPPPTLQSTDTDTDHTKGLSALVETKIKTQKFGEAIQIIERLIKIEPLEPEWPLLKAHVYSYSGNIESAKLGIEEILTRDYPLLVGDVFEGILKSFLRSGSEKLEDSFKTFESVMEEEKKKEELRDLKLLVAQVRVAERRYTEALEIYQELVKEELRDFRPYLCQGIVYSLLKKQDEAEKQFQMYQRLVPEGHPYVRYFEDNVIATKMVSPVADNQRAGSES